MKSRVVLNSVCLSIISRSSNIRTLNEFKSIRNKTVKIPSYVKESILSLFLSLLLLMLSLKMCAKIVAESCRILSRLTHIEKAVKKHNYNCNIQGVSVYTNLSQLHVSASSS